MITINVERPGPSKKACSIGGKAPAGRANQTVLSYYYGVFSHIITEYSVCCIVGYYCTRSAILYDSLLEPFVAVTVPVHKARYRYDRYEMATLVFVVVESCRSEASR